MSRTVGRFELSSVLAGAFHLDGGVVFGVVPKALWSRDRAPDAENRVRLVSRCLLIETEGRKLLVDGGPGQRFTDDERAIFGIDPGSEVTGGLAALGVEPEEITDVIVTHLHWDHAGGLTRVDSSGAPKLTFPKAVHHVQRRNWKWAHTPSEYDRRAYAPTDLATLSSSGRMHFVEGESEIMDGIRVFPTEGHTVGQQLVCVDGGESAVLYCGDTVPTAAHVRTSWGMGFDLYPMTLIEEKKQLLAEALEDRWLLFLCHDPDHTACTLREEEGRAVVDRFVEV